MNMKLLGAAVAAALLGLSTVSFGQASGQDTPREAGAAKSGPGSAEAGSPRGNANTSGATTSPADCSTLAGAAKRRCERDNNATSGSSSTAPGAVTKVPDQSGPGTNDKTEPKGKAGVGTSSAGSN
jgi:hypothetical protein